MITLGIETSCDETALCLLETRQSGEIMEYRILGNIVHSQIEMHREFGGVYPNLAKREHIKNLPILYEKLIKDSGISEDKIDQIAVTQGPGLEPALWTGIVFAQELNKKIVKPIIPVNHMEGHIFSTMLGSYEKSEHFSPLKCLDFTGLALLISGGHTEIVGVEKLGKYKILGRTKDDAIGEAFDKVARMLQLPYPGGPEISKLAEQARKENLPSTISLPRPMLTSKDLDFSFSGLKTAVLYLLKKQENLTCSLKKEICREFEDAVTEVVVAKLRKVLGAEEYKTLVVGGGVIANKHLRKALEKLAEEYSIPLFLPPKDVTGDNALMIALSGVLTPKTKNPIDLRADGNLSLES
jgi:N6-L-threonylcarbamoyladenine synthase